MKCLSLIVRESAKQDLVDRLQGLPQVSGYTIVAGEGHSLHTSKDIFETTRDEIVGYVPRIRIDLILEDKDVQPVLTALRQCDSCIAGRGMWWVAAVEDSGRL